MNFIVAMLLRSEATSTHGADAMNRVPTGYRGKLQTLLLYAKATPT